MNIFSIQTPVETVPILISSPHSGTDFPNEVLQQIKRPFTDNPPDTDWFIHQLYDFAPSMGITLIHANYSRYVIDLNRSPDSHPLYDDGRAITELVPTKSFHGEDLYDSPPDNGEIERRKELYYRPYHKKISDLLKEMKQSHKHVLFFDAHSIKKQVPSLSSAPFPDLILGNQDGKTADSQLVSAAEHILSSKGYSFSANKPFKGGYLTRSIGNPKNGIHALQLEMSQTVYMDEEKTLYDEKKANEIQTLLKNLFAQLTLRLQELNR